MPGNTPHCPWSRPPVLCLFCGHEVSELFAKRRCLECYVDLIETNGMNCRDQDIQRAFYIDLGGEA